MQRQKLMAASSKACTPTGPREGRDGGRQLAGVDRVCVCGQKTVKALPHPPERRELLGQTDLELVKASVSIVKFQPQAVDWGAVGPWAGVLTPLTLEAVMRG